MNVLKRTLLLLLVLATVLGAFASCVKAGKKEPPTTVGNDPAVEQPDALSDQLISEIRTIADGTRVKASGIVACITYSFGKVPAGIMLVDHTQSIYVYDAELASQVKVGNYITIEATKTMWILEDEQKNAEKFGYKGCCQLEDATLVSNDKGNTPFDTEWIKSTTIKAILDTPVTENITSAIYKVTALVEKREGTGFTNYYFTDLDGTTSSYTYTQCNGSDFTWLDEFDGKICTVYLTPLNAKSTASDCYFRFIPVRVVDEGFSFDEADTPRHIVDYYGLPQFLPTYTGDPVQAMRLRVSSDLLHFEDATLSYSSDNTDVIWFEETNGQVIFHCKNPGTAIVTVTGHYHGYQSIGAVMIQVLESPEFDAITVAAAQGTAVGETVIVRGIVGPSAVNQPVFYLFDDTGMIAVKVQNSDTFASIAVGHEIVITGKRDCVKDTQICISDATVIANYYGKHNYNDSWFVTDKSFDQLATMTKTAADTTNVYVVTATVEWVETSYYTNVKLINGSVSMNLYCSGAGQYAALLERFKGQEITMEITVCNWNGKSFAACVLAVRLPDEKIYNQLNFES